MFPNADGDRMEAKIEQSARNVDTQLHGEMRRQILIVVALCGQFEFHYADSAAERVSRL